MDKVLVFDIWGEYAHFKKIYATTSAVTYMIPPKPTLYGYVSAVLGKRKEENEYLRSFSDGVCQLGLQIMKPIIMQRINTNLRSVLGRMPINGNRKPTMVEYVYQPKYRIFLLHSDKKLQDQLKTNLMNHISVYTPSLGLANLISNFELIGEFQANKNGQKMVSINSIIPRSKFVKFDIENSISNENEIVEISQFSIEMDTERNVTKRDDVFLDRTGKAIKAEVKEYYELNIENEIENIMLF